MSQREGFTSGLFLGVAIGGLFGGLIGAVVASQGRQGTEEEEENFLKKTEAEQIPVDSEESMEFARRSLEDKIAQLNLAIDDVRQQLSSVNGNAAEVEKDAL